MKHVNVALFVPHAGCPHQCSFCDQRAITGQEAFPTPDAVSAAAETALQSGRVDPASSEIAFFGGSFTALPRDKTAPLLERAALYVRRGLFHGIRLSTRPDVMNGETAAMLKEYGVTAVELGAQSMDHNVLSRNGRGHTPEDTCRAAECIHSAGMELGLQMMTGLPGDTDAGAMETARRLAALRPATMRIYPTLVLHGTQLAVWYEQRMYTPQPLDEAVVLCAELLENMEQEGIRVIRLGLHDNDSLRQNRIAGPWHPAFRELCEGELFYRAELAALAPYPAGEYRLLTAPGCLSKASGQGKRNLERLGRLGYRCRVGEDARLRGRQIVIQRM